MKLFQLEIQSHKCYYQNSTPAVLPPFLRSRCKHQHREKSVNIFITKMVLTSRCHGRTMGTPQTTAENHCAIDKGGSVVSTNTSPHCGFGHFHSVRNIVRGVLRAHVFPWVCRLHLYLVSDTRRASRVQKIRVFPEEKQPPLHSSQCCHTEAQASVATSVSEETSEIVLYVKHFEFQNVPADEVFEPKTLARWKQNTSSLWIWPAVHEQQLRAE